MSISPKTGYTLGLDIGSVNAKLTLLDGGQRPVQSDIERVTSNTDAAVDRLLSRLNGKASSGQITSVGVSGGGRESISRRFKWPEFSSSLAIASGLLQSHPDARTIIQIGGQSSVVMELADGLKKPWKLVSNPLCAAGTGRFLEQQAYRLGISMADFANLALKYNGKPPRIAARCSVFAKTDLIHLQQKGVPIEALLNALCESVARMVASLKKGPFLPPVYFAGGVSANAAIVKALHNVLSERNGSLVEVIVPENSLYLESIGAALLSAGKCESVDFSAPVEENRTRFFEMPRLEDVSLPGNGAVNKITAPCRGYLGVDIGSTSTKAVILDESGKEVLAKNYLMTAGKPVEAVKEVFRNLLECGADKVAIVASGITGSGRYLVGSFIGADLVKNEITAQARAAVDIDPDADIIEIGGQDSKLIIKRNGTVVDYQMNKACAAGTGSFIDELAEMLQVHVKNGDFARLAFTAPHTIDLGTRCAAFMGQAVASAQQDGVPLGVITASLAQAIARNYLTKVVGTRKLGNKVILAGAVFYNAAVVSAFRQQLKGKTLIVAEQREVSGAIGVALLAKEQGNKKSTFKGFKEVVESDCTLSAFTCQSCDNNCTITRMKLPDGKPTFYGSRCDKYDSALTQAARKTLFDEREKMLLQHYKPDSGKGPVVGVPRALMVYEFAPLIIGFLNELGAKVVVSSQTTKEIMHQSVELSYSDSCLPLKLVHGHVAALKDTDFIFDPCFIRMGKKDTDSDQKYACPLVQASPFIVRHILGLGDKLLAPVVDLSMGEADIVENFARVAAKLGFSRGKGRQAARSGLEAQMRFREARQALGGKTLRDLKESHQLGVVLLARPYMAQDSGANLGIAEKLAQLGVVPVPLDFLPLISVDPRQYSDRPYWFCEGQHISGASIIASVPQLYGLFLTNFGCGPNSFMLKLIEDIMGGKPLGELEIDEHAAEAGIVTRLEAFVDTIRGHAASVKASVTSVKTVYRGASTTLDFNKIVLLPRMCPHVDAIVAAMNACGGKAEVLPEPNDSNIVYSAEVSSGKECLPYRVTLGDFIRFCHEHDGKVEKYEGLMASAYGPCRLGKYVLEQDRILKDLGYNLVVRNSISNNAYRDMNLDKDFLHLALNCVSAVDGLQRLVWRTRPYERVKGSSDAAFDEYLKKISQRALKKEPVYDLLRQAADEFKGFIDTTLPKRPLIGINGEVYLRSNRFSNRDLVKVCEDAGLEVVVSPMGEWGRYIVHRHFEDAMRERKLKKIATAYLIRYVLRRDDHRVSRSCDFEANEVSHMLSKSRRYLSSKCGSEAVLSIGSGVDWLENPAFAGVISVMPHGCMPGGIVAAMGEKFSTVYQKPWISVTFDGFLETNNVMRVREFAELVRFCINGGSSYARRS